MVPRGDTNEFQNLILIPSPNDFVIIKTIPSFLKACRVCGDGPAQGQDGLGRMKVRAKDAGLRGSSARGTATITQASEGCDQREQFLAVVSNKQQSAERQWQNLYPRKEIMVLGMGLEMAYRSIAGCHFRGLRPS